MRKLEKTIILLGCGFVSCNPNSPPEDHYKKFMDEIDKEIERKRAAEERMKKEEKERKDQTNLARIEPFAHKIEDYINTEPTEAEIIEDMINLGKELKFISADKVLNSLICFSPNFDMEVIGARRVFKNRSWGISHFLFSENTAVYEKVYGTFIQAVEYLSSLPKYNSLTKPHIAAIYSNPQAINISDKINIILQIKNIVDIDPRILCELIKIDEPNFAILCKYEDLKEIIWHGIEYLAKASPNRLKLCLQNNYHTSVPDITDDQKFKIVIENKFFAKEYGDDWFNKMEVAESLTVDELNKLFEKCKDSHFKLRIILLLSNKDPDTATSIDFKSDTRTISERIKELLSMQDSAANK